MRKTSCFDVFERCVKAVKAGELIESVSQRDKEFHFQNWVRSRLEALRLDIDEPGRNTYPDFRLVKFAEGYEVKGLKYPGREASYDANSQVPTGLHNGRHVFYVFGRYPADLTPYEDKSRKPLQYPVIDMVLCHGNFLNVNHDYVHKNRNLKGFGSYGDIMIRDRKMYVAPTPFALTEGTTGLMTLIVPEKMKPRAGFQEVGQLCRVETDRLVVAYTFDLRTNEIRSDQVGNPSAGAEHRFIAYRLSSQASKPVSLTSTAPVLTEEDPADDE